MKLHSRATVKLLVDFKISVILFLLVINDLTLAYKRYAYGEKLTWGLSYHLVISLFGFEGRMWDLIVSVPDHCLSVYLTCFDQ